jgi:DNA polymerase-3 subunit delta'
MTEQLNKILSLVSEKQLNCSILLYGNRGIGKSHLVRAVAREVLKTNTSPDLLLLETPISIDDVRRAIDFTTTKPISSCKILIFDSIDYMSINGLNAMLKLLEEPPSDLYIFLIASSLYNIPKTIRSRCLTIYLKKKSLEDFSEIVRLNRNDLSNEAITYLYEALEGDINNTITVRNDMAKVVSLGKPQVNELLDLLSLTPDDTVVKIAIFEMAKEAKVSDRDRQLYLLEKVEFFISQYAKIRQYNLNEANALFSIVHSLNL